MTPPLPANGPAPMTPPKAIIIMCRCFSVCRRPLEPKGPAASTPAMCESPVAVDSHVAQRVADGGHRIAQYAGADGADAADAKRLDRGQFARIQDETALANPPIKFGEVVIRIGRGVECHDDRCLQRIGQEGLEAVPP